MLPIFRRWERLVRAGVNKERLTMLELPPDLLEAWAEQQHSRWGTEQATCVRCKTHAYGFSIILTLAVEIISTRLEINSHVLRINKWDKGCELRLVQLPFQAHVLERDAIKNKTPKRLRSSSPWGLSGAEDCRRWVISEQWIRAWTMVEWYISEQSRQQRLV